MTLAVALDFEATRIKAGLLGGNGRLERVISTPAPPLRGMDPIREGDAVPYVEVAAGMLREVSGSLPRGTPLGLACQRSTFLLWDRRTGEPATPMISWLDRRAAGWCNRHAAIARRVALQTGLRLSPHYAGPKLATILEAEPGLWDRLRTGRLVFGNLDAYVLSTWSGERSHETDLSMAARTLLADLAHGWNDEMLELFGVPRSCLPEIRATVGKRVPLPLGPTVTATIADQASSVLAALGSERDAVLVNLGTGGFVLRAIGETPAPMERYLCGPILCGPDGRRFYALEGTINGVSVATDRFGAGPTELPEEDPTPDAFCLPDAAGVGSPHWLPELSLLFSPPAHALEDRLARRIVLEGILFRVHEILDDLCREASPSRLLLSGGLARDPFLPQGLASCLRREVEVLEEPEATLLGVARLAAGLEPHAGLGTVPFSPGRGGGYLRTKYERWKSWLREVLPRAE